MPVRIRAIMFALENLAGFVDTDARVAGLYQAVVTALDIQVVSVAKARARRRADRR